MPTKIPDYVIFEDIVDTTDRVDFSLDELEAKDFDDEEWGIADFVRHDWEELNEAEKIQHLAEKGYTPHAIYLTMREYSPKKYPTQKVIKDLLKSNVNTVDEEGNNEPLDTTFNPSWIERARYYKDRGHSPESAHRTMRELGHENIPSPKMLRQMMGNPAIPESQEIETSSGLAEPPTQKVRIPTALNREADNLTHEPSTRPYVGDDPETERAMNTVSIDHFRRNLRRELLQKYVPHLNEKLQNRLNLDADLSSKDLDRRMDEIQKIVNTPEFKGQALQGIMQPSSMENYITQATKKFVESHRPTLRDKFHKGIADISKAAANEWENLKKPMQNREARPWEPSFWGEAVHPGQPGYPGNPDTQHNSGRSGDELKNAKDSFLPQGSIVDTAKKAVLKGLGFGITSNETPTKPKGAVDRIVEANKPKIFKGKTKTLEEREAHANRVAAKEDKERNWLAEQKKPIPLSGNEETPFEFDFCN